MPNNLRKTGTNNVSKVVVSLFVILAISVSLISTFHSFDFFILTNSGWMSWFLAITFEIGQLAALAAIVVNNRLDMRIVWPLMIFLSLMQIMTNIYYSYSHMSEDYVSWSEMFGAIELEEINQKRLIAVISGGFLPLIALGFTKSLVDYLKGEKEPETVGPKIPPVGTYTVSTSNRTLAVSTPITNPTTSTTSNTNPTPVVKPPTTPPNSGTGVIPPIPKSTNTPVTYPIDNSSVIKVPKKFVNDKSPNFDYMLDDKSLVNRIPFYGIKEFNGISKDQWLDTLRSNKRLLSLVKRAYDTEQKKLKGRKTTP